MRSDRGARRSGRMEPRTRNSSSTVAATQPAHLTWHVSADPSALQLFAKAHTEKVANLLGLDSSRTRAAGLTGTNGSSEQPRPFRSGCPLPPPRPQPSSLRTKALRPMSLSDRRACVGLLGHDLVDKFHEQHDPGLVGDPTRRVPPSPTPNMRSNPCVHGPIKRGNGRSAITKRDPQSVSPLPSVRPVPDGHLQQLAWPFRTHPKRNQRPGRTVMAAGSGSGVSRRAWNSRSTS